MKSGLIAVAVAGLAGSGLSAPAAAPLQGNTAKAPGAVSLPDPSTTRNDPIARLPDTSPDPPQPIIDKPIPTSTDAPIDPKQGTEVLTRLLSSLLHGHSQNSHHARHAHQGSVAREPALAVDRGAEAAVHERRTVGLVFKVVQKLAKSMGILDGLGAEKRHVVDRDMPPQVLDKRQSSLIEGLAILTGQRREKESPNSSPDGPAGSMRPFTPDIAKRDAAAPSKRQPQDASGLVGDLGGLVGKKKHEDKDDMGLGGDGPTSDMLGSGRSPFSRLNTVGGGLAEGSQRTPNGAFPADVMKRDAAAPSKRKPQDASGLLGDLGGLVGKKKPEDKDDMGLGGDGPASDILGSGRNPFSRLNTVSGGLTEGSQRTPNGAFPADVMKRDGAVSGKRQLGGLGALGGLGGLKGSKDAAGEDEFGLPGPPPGLFRGDSPGPKGGKPDNRGNPEFTAIVPGFTKRDTDGEKSAMDRIERAMQLMSLLPDGDGFAKRAKTQKSVPLGFAGGKPDLGVTDVLANKPSDLGLSDAVSGAVNGGSGKNAETHPGLFKPIATLLGLRDPIPKPGPGLPSPDFDPTGQIPSPGTVR